MNPAALLALLLAAGPEVSIVPVGERQSGPEGILQTRLGEPGRLAVVVAQEGRCWSGRPGTIFHGQACELASTEARQSAQWFVAMPQARDYDNSRRCLPREAEPGCHDPILYDLVELLELRGKLDVDVRDSARLSTLGTHRIAVRLQWQGGDIGSAMPTTSLGADEAVPKMFEVVIRRDDTYVGRLTELLGVPFVLGPVHLPGVGHQTDRRLGADCVALVIYGRRRLGETLGYVAPPILKDWMTPVGSAAALVGHDGQVADVGPVREGDVLHFGFQTAVLARDNPPTGRLDPSDIIIHTFHGLAEEVPLGRLPYRQRAVEVLRWPTSSD